MRTSYRNPVAPGGKDFHPASNVDVTLSEQLVWLFVLAIPIASISWTVTQEEVFREPREYAQHKLRAAGNAWTRKFFYVLTCHYCFSHYITAALLALTRYKLLYQDWRGYLIAGFALVWVANVYMSLYATLRQDYKKTTYEAKAVEQEVKSRVSEPAAQIHKPAA